MTLGESIASPGNPTQTRSTTRTLQLQVLHTLDANTVLAAGVISTHAGVDLKHNGGEIINSGIGLQLDAMRKVSASFGFTGRLVVDRIRRTTAIPSATSTNTVSVREGQRVYSEFNVALTLQGSETSVIPDGWRLRPVLTGVYQWSRLGAVGNELSRTAKTTSEEFGGAFLTARLEQTAGGPWLFRPYAEAGGELQFLNTASQVSNDPVTLYLRAGIATSMGTRGRLDLYYVRREGLNGEYKSNAISALFSFQFS